jgi:uroporphyrinogen-III synthase
MPTIAVNLRPKEQSHSLSEKLNFHGLQVFEFPTVEISALTHEIPEINHPNIWIAATSANAIKFFREKSILSQCPLAVIGDSTAQAARKLGVEPKFISSVADAVSFAKEFVEFVSKKGKVQVIFLKGSSASDNFVRVLREAEIDVDEVLVYGVTRRLPEGSEVENLLAVLGLVDSALRESPIICATSSLALKSFCEIIADNAGALVADWQEKLANIPLAVIGPVTESAAKEFGFNKIVIAESASMESLAATVARNS